MAQILRCCDSGRRLAAIASIRPLAWETPYAPDAALKSKIIIIIITITIIIIIIIIIPFIDFFIEHPAADIGMF